MNDDKYEVVLRLVKEEAKDSFIKELNTLGIPFALGHLYEWQGKKYKGFLFLKDIWKEYREKITIDVYTHPTIDSMLYSMKDVYHIFFDDEVRELWNSIQNPSSLICANKRKIDDEIRIFLKKLELTEKYIKNFSEVDCNYPEMKLQDVRKKFERFLKRGCYG